MEAFRTNPRLAVIERIAGDLAYAKGKLYRVDEAGEEHELTDHPFLEFWKHPNPLHEMSNAALWRLLEIYLKLKGEGYFIIEKDEAGRPAELWPVPTHWVQQTPYLDHPFYTVRLTSGVIMPVSVDDMFVMKDLNPVDPFRRGLGQAEALADEIETDEYAAKFQKRFFFNDATPNLVIAMPKSTEEQRKRFRAEWMERFKGVFKSHGVATVNGEAIINKVGDNMKDMDMVNGRTFLRNAVLEHFGVPREIMGITESSNRATSEAAQYIYAQNVLMPSLLRREEAINEQIIPLFGPDLVWHFEDIVPRNQEFDKAKAMDGWNAGLMTRDEARELLDLPPDPVGGNVYKATFSDLYLPADEDPAEAMASLAPMDDAGAAQEGGQDVVEVEGLEGGDPALNGEGESKETVEVVGLKKQKAAEELKAVRLKDAQRLLMQAEREQGRRFEIATAKYFREQSNRIAAAVNGTQKAERSVWDILLDGVAEYDTDGAGAWYKLDEAERMSRVDAFVLGLIDWTGEESVLASIFTPLWQESYKKGVEVAAKVYGLEAIQRPELVSVAKLRGGARVRHITQTTQKEISRIVSAGLENGDSRATIAGQIQQEMQTTSARAKTIAAQECNSSLLSGNFDMMKRAGAAWKTWHVTNMAVARDSHKALNGKRIPIDATFPNGCRFPCDPDCGKPEEVVNCHCFLTYDE
ncbi:phage portal protein [bacterium 1xD42-67]|nr:phage portal protein [bacterium 1xD42-67]